MLAIAIDKQLIVQKSSAAVPVPIVRDKPGFVHDRSNAIWISIASVDQSDVTYTAHLLLLHAGGLHSSAYTHQRLSSCHQAWTARCEDRLECNHRASQVQLQWPWVSEWRGFTNQSYFILGRFVILSTVYWLEAYTNVFRFPRSPQGFLLQAFLPIMTFTATFV